MGEQLAKDVKALLKANLEQRPEWHKAMEKGGAPTNRDAVRLLNQMFGALRETILFLAREIDDPPRNNP